MSAPFSDDERDGSADRPYLDWQVREMMVTDFVGDLVDDRAIWRELEM